MRLLLSRSPEQQAALDQFMAQQLDASSPNYHHWLTPAEYGRLYGAADSDVAAVVAWLQSQGFKVDSVSAGRTNIAFSGTVAQAERAFHTSIHAFNARGESFLSNTVNPKIPSALTPVVSGIARLNTLQPKAQHRLGQTGQYDPAKGGMVVNSRPGVQSQLKPQLSFQSNGFPYLAIVPADAATIYNTPNPDLNANYSGASVKGTGVTIGIAGASAILTGPVVNYRNKFLGDTKAPTIIDADPNGTPQAGGANEIEAYLDTEIAGGLAPGANISLYLSSDLLTGMDRAISDNTVDIFSVSFGVCEAFVSTDDNAMFRELWRQAASQGIAVTVSTGDSGSAGCDDSSQSTNAVFGLGVNALASTPFNIAVGGTDTPILQLPADFATYVTPPGLVDGSIAGSAGTYYRTAKSYIPEATWNDSTTQNNLLDQNIAWSFTDPTLANIVAGGGGKSSCVVNDSSNSNIPTVCTSGYEKPSWQRGFAVPADGARDLPDVSLISGDGFNGAEWLLCDHALISNGVYRDCSGSSFNFDGVGGTSAAAPAFAGMLALVQEKAGARLGLAAKTLYDLYNGAHAADIFHDVQDGNNSVPCVNGKPDCAMNGAGFYFLTGYDTSAGYDLATGMGSVDVSAMVNYWSTAIGSEATTVTLSTNPSSITLSQGFTATVNVSGALGEATGTVTLTGGGYNSGIQNLAGGSFTFSVPANTFAAGNVTLTATYSGDSNYATKTATTSITVTDISSTMAVTPSATSILINQPLSVQAVVSGAGATPTGTVLLAGGGYTSPAQTLANGSYTFLIPAGSLAKGPDTLTVSYSGDSNYSGTTATTSVTVRALTPTIAVTPSATSFPASQSITVTATITGAGSTPTGSVTLSGGGYSVGAQTLANGSYTFTIPAGSLANGNDTLLVSYGGDATYAAATATASVTVTSSLTPTISLTPSATSIYAAQPMTLTAMVSGTGAAPTGKVTLTSGSYSSGPQSLINGSFTFALPANSLAVGTDTLTVSYAGDTNYVAASNTVAITVSGAASASVKATPAKASIVTSESLDISVAVTGAMATPTGSVTITSGSYTSAATNLANGSATVTVPANSLAVGSATLTVTYNGDMVFPAASTTTAITVKAPYALSASAPAAISKGGSAVSNVSFTADATYTGTVSLECALTSSPSGATSLPVCSVTPSVSITNGTPSGMATVTLSSTTKADLQHDGLPGWLRTGGGAVLACLVFFGIPSRRRSWRNLLGILAVLAALSGLSACGTATVAKNPGTTSGAYTFTITGMGSPAVNPAPTATVNLTIN